MISSMWPSIDLRIKKKVDQDDIDKIFDILYDYIEEYKLGHIENCIKYKYIIEKFILICKFLKYDTNKFEAYFNELEKEIEYKKMKQQRKSLNLDIKGKAWNQQEAEKRYDKRIIKYQ